MPTLYPLQDSWVRGEISPRLHARASLELYRAGLAKCVNFLTLPHGGIRKRGGTRFAGSTRYPALRSRLIPFIFSSEQAYVLELGNHYCRVWAYGARVGTVEVVTPWEAYQLDDIQYYQSADQMWLAHPDHELRVLTREAHETWTIATYEIDDGPYDEMDMKGTTLTPADYGSLTPLMTSNTAPSGTVTGTGSGANMFMVFDKNLDNDFNFSALSGFVAYQLASGFAVVDHYWLKAKSDSNEAKDTPSAWVLEGSNDGVSYTTLDTRTAETGWTGGETRFYDFPNEAGFIIHRFRWKSVDGSEADGAISELGINRAAVSQTPFNLYASSGTGLNDGVGFLASDVGRAIRLQGSDGEWRWAEIVSWVDAGTVTVLLHGHALPDLSPIGRWQFGTFTAGKYPEAVSVYEERLALAKKFSVYLSKTGDLDNFSPGEADDDGMSFTNAGGGQANDIVWIADGDGYLLLATTGGVRQLSGSGIDEALTPSSFKNRRSRTSGAAKIAPVDAGSSFLYVTRSRRTIAELAMNQYGRFSSDDVGQISEHIPKQGVNAIAWAENPDPVLWFTLDSGELGGYTHQPAQEVRGMHHHRTGEPLDQIGFSLAADIFESICVTPGADGQNDDVWVIVRRETGGATKRYIEMLTAPLEAVGGAVASVMDAFAVDSGLTYTGAAIGTVTGLDHLEGETVSVLADRRVYHGLTVSGGAVTLPGGATAAKMHAGLPFGCLAETLELDVGGKDGSLMGRRKNVKAVILSLLETDTSGLSIRSQQRGAWETVRIPSVAAPDGTVSLFTGNVTVPIEDSWEGRGKILLVHTSPTPITIRGMVPVFESEP